MAIALLAVLWPLMVLVIALLAVLWPLMVLAIALFTLGLHAVYTNSISALKRKTSVSDSHFGSAEYTSLH